MSDLLALTGWIGEHPRTGADVAHLLLYAATDLDPASSAKMGSLAVDILGMSRTQMNTTNATINPTIGRLLLPGQELPLPGLWQGEWATAATAQGFVIVSVTDQPLTAPTLATLDRFLATVPMWSGFAPVTNHQ